MAPPVASASIPLVTELYNLLGFEPSRKGPLKTATYEWRRQYLRRFGKNVIDLLDWVSAQDECISLAISFLLHKNNGEDFWPSNNGLAADVLKYPKDQTLITDILSQLFWRQNHNDHQYRHIYEAGKQGGDLAVADQTMPIIRSDPKAADPVRSSTSLPKRGIADIKPQPKIPPYHQKWEWPHLQLGRTRSTSFAAKNTEAAGNTEVPTRPVQQQPEKAKTPRTHMRSVSSPIDEKDHKSVVEQSSDEVERSSPKNAARELLSCTILYDPKKYVRGIAGHSINTLNADKTGIQGRPTSQSESINGNVQKRAASNLDSDYDVQNLGKRKKNRSGEERPNPALTVTNAMRSRFSEGPDSPALMQMFLPGYAVHKMDEGQVPALQSFQGPAAVTSTTQASGIKQHPANTKEANVFFSIITARSPRLHSFTWVRGALHNRTVRALFDEISQFVSGSHIHRIVFTLYTSNAAYSTTVEHGDENVYTRMRQRWTRIIMENMTEEQNSEFEVELEPKYGAGLENARGSEENFDITL